MKNKKLTQQEIIKIKAEHIYNLAKAAKDAGIEVTFSVPTLLN